MWNALRTDLTEFVSTVTGETAEALNQMDARFPEASSSADAAQWPSSAAEQEASRRMALEETYTTPLYDVEEEEEEAVEGNEEPKTNEKKEENSKDSTSAEPTPDTEPEQGTTKEAETEQPTGVEEDGEDDDEDDETAEVKEFIASFSIDSKTDEIATLLEQYPETLKAHFETLVPTTVTYEDFWMRYFYRCDADRIQAEWDAEEEALKQARAQAVQQGLSTVRNLLGGAVKAVSSTLEEGGTAAANSASGAKGYFGSAGRPPFVMNTAVSEDDLEGDEEEELGWDEDSDDEDFEPNEPVSGDDEDGMDTEQIEFNDPVTEKLQDELKQALAERDSLQQTVELQKKELVALKEGKMDSDQVEQLKTKLFEKESEIAAIRASMADADHHHTDHSVNREQEVSGLKSEIASLTNKLKMSESAVSNAMAECKSCEAELKRTKSELMTKTKALEDNSDEKNELAKKVTSLQSEVTKLKTENNNLQGALDSSRENASREKSSLVEMDNLQAEISKLKAALALAEEQNVQLEAALTETKEALRLKEEAAKVEEEAKSVDSPDTGIKIEPPVIGKLDEEDEMGDGWDDDW